MKIRCWNLGLVMATCLLSLWLMASFLDQFSSQNNLYDVARTQLRTCHCPSNSSRKCGCYHEVHSCSVCLHIPGESDWFDRRFASAIEPLQRSEGPMSYDALGLQSVNLVRETENKQQQLIKPPSRRPLGPMQSNCQTCAVVGNSRSLRGSGLGSRINQHDMVLRINQAPVQGFEADVGNMTTMRIMYPDIASTQDPGAQLLLLPLNSSALEWFISVLQKQNYYFKAKNPGYRMVQYPDGNEDKILVISLSFLKYIQESWLEYQGPYPSLGFVALLYALHTCDQVSLFGFGADHHNTWFHYWDDKYWFNNSMQHFPAERMVIHRLHCEGKVHVYK
nr:CMP-N-acetylneuraminate-beta-galactosamide-alpha-2,3-sialyltransferase 1-like isoform X2 [Microcebus murinus]